jgi:hypothetical protein
VSAFTDVIHKVATIGEHTVEWVEGHDHITVNGALVVAEDLSKLIAALHEVAPLVGALVTDAAAA